jgi:hypothetical protein
MAPQMGFRPNPNDNESNPDKDDHGEPDLVTRPIEQGWVRELRATDQQLDDLLFRRHSD